MVSVCFLSDALLQHLPSYLGFSYLGRGISLQGCSSKVHPLLLTLDEGYLLTAALPDLQRGVAPLGHAFCALARRSQPPAPPVRCVQGKEQWLRFAGAAMKRYPTPKVRETQVRR